MRLRFYFNKKQSKNIALDRLKVLLISDRVDCNPEVMDMLKNDIAKVISKYLEIDADSINVSIKKNNTKDSFQAKLCANVPIKSVSNNLIVKQ